MRDLIKFIALFLSALLFAGVAAVASASATEVIPGMSLLGEKSVAKREQGIEILAGSGHPAAAGILNAMVEGDLYFRKTDNKLLIAKPLGEALSLFDPITSNDLGSSSSQDLEKVRVNNKLRRLIRGLLGGLNLSHPDRTVRKDAAANLLKSPDPEIGRAHV